MFWGKGDTSKLEDREAQTLSDLRRMVETGHIVALTPEQSQLALRALDWYEMWESTFKLLGSIRNTAILLGFLIGLWWTTEGRVLDIITWLKK
jgi:hypothetical protein